MAILNQPPTVTDKTLSLADPSQVMGFGNTLKKFIVDNKLSVKIENNDYSMVDGWKFAGLNFGLTAIPGMPEKKSKDGEYITILYSQKKFFTKDNKEYTKEVIVFIGFTRDQSVIDQVKLETKISREMVRPYVAYSCDCSIIRLADGMKVGRGTGFCDNMEVKKASFDEYAIISMSETRSIGKSYRNLIGYVMKAAGFEPTPAEEMDGVKVDHEVHGSKNKPAPSHDEFKAIMKDVQARGQSSLDLAKEHFTLTPEQLRTLEIMIPKDVQV